MIKLLNLSFMTSIMYLAGLIAFWPIQLCRAAETTILISGMHLTHPIKIRAGHYRLKDSGNGILQVSGHDFTLDLKGVQISGPAAESGYGIQITDAINVTISHAKVNGCLWGIVLDHCRSVNLISCDTSHNRNHPAGFVIDESGSEPQDQWGGGILIRNSVKCTVKGCKSNSQWDGLAIVSSSLNQIRFNDLSYNNNWGVHLWDSSNNRVVNNHAIWCTTGSGKLYQALTGWQTYDAEAVCIEHSSRKNLIQGNDLRFGGDGIFIRANEGGIEPGTSFPPKNSSNGNLLIDNDCSFSPNNAIEADGVSDTIIKSNNCSLSNYGMWLGYSRGSQVIGNICVDDSTRAIEIENGRNGLLAHNVFGYDQAKGDDPLVLLRQNGRDKTPSGPYLIKKNVFYYYGAGSAMLLSDTAVRFEGNIIISDKLPGADTKVLVSDSASHLTQIGNRERGFTPQTTGKTTFLLTYSPIERMRGMFNNPAGAPPVIELNGIPLWIRSFSSGAVRFQTPSALWDTPIPDHSELRYFNGEGWIRSISAFLPVIQNTPGISKINPNPAHIGDPITILGSKLNLGTLLLEGIPVRIISRTSHSIQFSLPESIFLPMNFNLALERYGEPLCPPVSFHVEVPNRQSPHILSAAYSPTTLHAGQILSITLTVRNNLPVPAALMQNPPPGFLYQENQSLTDTPFHETPGTIHLRVTSDHPGTHDPGSWPWFFGFGQPFLAPGAEITVTGRIQLQTPGVHIFRVGLVASGYRFIDDSVFQKKITVLP